MSQTNPITRNKVQQLLGLMPASVWSTWADEVRNKDRSYSRWHHINVNDIDKPCNGQENIKCGIILTVNVLKGKSHVMPKDIALKLLLHLVADAHQPLHISMPKFYNGKCFFKTNKTYSFHRYMDYDVVRKPYRGVSDVADIIANVRAYEKVQAESPVAHWLKESADLQYLIMPGLKQGVVPSYCKISKKRVEPVVLDNDRLQTMAEISWLQMARASKRLAFLLDDVFHNKQVRHDGL